jgi:8-oxo-dGTP pyrophosphatase MutT (NUDIX family)
MTSFRVVDTTTRWRAGFLVLDEAHVLGPHDEQLTRSVVRHPGAVVVVPVDADRKHALMVRQYRAAVDGALLEVVAGKRDIDDEPPPETARRELEEEVGYRTGRLVKLCEFYNSPGFCDEYTHLYCALDLVALESPRGVTAEERAMTVERVAFDGVEALIATGELTDAKSIIGLLLTRRYLDGDYAGMPGDE